MGRSLENRSLDRGIMVLETLARDGACRLADLERGTGLPKSTLRRLLQTLLKRRLVRRSINDGLFRVNVALPLIRTEELTASAARLVDAATPHLEALTERVLWPSDLQIRDGTRMRIVESTRPLSPFHMRRGFVDLQVPIFCAAAGRALLSTMDDDEIRALARETRDDPRWGLARCGGDIERLLRQIAEVRRRGYATRAPGYTGELVADDHIQALSAPLFWRTRAIGAVTLAWTREFLSVAAFAERYFDALKATAEAISADLAEEPPPKPE